MPQTNQVASWLINPLTPSYFILCVSGMYFMNANEYAITELTRSMKLAAEREEYQCAADMKRIKEGIEKLRGETRVFTENEIAQLQDRIHKIVGNGEVMQEFNKLLGINAS